MLSAELRAVVDGHADGAAVIDAGHRLLYFNDAYARLSGRSRARLQQRVDEGARCSEVLPLSVCAKECVALRALDSGLPLRVDRVGLAEPVDLQKSVVEVFADVQELRVAATPLAGGLVLETYRDTTAESRLHARWREAIRKEREQKQELNELVATRSADLVRTNEALRRTQAHLVQQEKMSSLGLLVAGVAHEINNPINFIVCNLPFLEQYVSALEQLVESLETAVSPAAHDAIDELRVALEIEYLRNDAPQLMQSIRTGANRAAAIVADLRAFSRGGDERDVAVDLVAGIETTINLLKPTTSTANVAIEREYGKPGDSAKGSVFGQPGQLNQVFMNLIGNAVHAVLGRPPSATSPGRVIVRVVDEEHHVRLEVEDNGVGIAAEHRARVFDPFFTTKPVGQGTGLGLSISYGIVERHGGTMQFTSVLGEGSTFTVRLPKILPRDPMERGEAQ